jgi:hypothetical protein
MLQYNTSLKNSPPLAAGDRQKALEGLKIKSPWNYGSAHRDILNASNVANQAAYDVEATKVNADYEMKQKDAERRLVLAGLQQMNEAQQNQQQLANTRLGNMYGMVGNLLGGLFN